MLIGVLGVLWLVVLAPPLVRSRSAHRRGSDFSAFYSSLSRLGHGRGRPGASPLARSADASRGARRRTAMRRRRVYTSLGSAMGVTFILGSLANSQLMWLLFGIATALLVAYTALLVWMKKNELVQVNNVSYLPVRLASPEFALRRTVNS